MIAPNTFSQLPEEQILSFEHRCREILAKGTNGAVPAPETVAANGDKVHEQAAKLIELTARLFPPGILEVSREYDPDSPGYTYLVVDVVGDGDSKEIFRRQDDWHAGVTHIFSDPATWLSICIYPR
jgi:hypothetical protein